MAGLRLGRRRAESASHAAWRLPEHFQPSASAAASASHTHHRCSCSPDRWEGSQTGGRSHICAVKWRRPATDCKPQCAGLSSSCRWCSSSRVCASACSRPPADASRELLLQLVPPIHAYASAHLVVAAAELPLDHVLTLPLGAQVTINVTGLAADADVQVSTQHTPAKTYQLRAVCCLTSANSA